MNKKHLCVFGLGWGDEGKGKIVDLLGGSFDVVTRFNGGANAGHTIRIGSERFALHLIPTGLIRPGMLGMIGPGVVVDPITLFEEIDQLLERGIDVAGRLVISDRAHLVMPYHKIEDKLHEGAASDKTRIGTTARGIGPCYADKARRSVAVRFCDLLYEDGLPQRISSIVAGKRASFQALFGQHGGLNTEAVLSLLDTARQRLSPFIANTTCWLREQIATGKRVLFEGANGLLLDIDHGTYPFVTSSSTGPHGLAAGSGVSPQTVQRFVGTIKAYSTRVGAGPFVSELTNEMGDAIRKKGHEYGTTTGRPRRCGWFDAVATRYAVNLTGCTDVALMHLDTLGGFDHVGICVSYNIDGEQTNEFPSDPHLLSRAKPVFEYVEGWSDELAGIRRFEDLPSATRDYISRIESLIETPISIASVGADRAETLVHDRFRNILSEMTNA